MNLPMNEFENAMEQSCQNLAQGGSLNYPGAIGGQIDPLMHAKMEAAQREYADRGQRQEALRIAIEMCRGTGFAADHQAIIRAARDFLAFIDKG